jgi:hypothetical protein
LRGLTIPLLIKNRVITIPHRWSGNPTVYSYREVFVFGFRIIRYQQP